MFTAKELKNIDRNYFHIIHAGCYSVTLQSRNTRHYWHILRQEYPSFATCKIQHKHQQTDYFHEQGNKPSLEQALHKIHEHDHYHLHVRPAKKNDSERMIQVPDAHSIAHIGRIKNTSIIQTIIILQLYLIT